MSRTELRQPIEGALRVAVVEDQRAFAQSLQLVLEDQPDMACVGVTGTGESSIQLCRDESPDVVVMDIDLPGIDGIEAAGQLLEQHDGLTVVILTALADASLLARAASVGVHAFLLKDSSIEEVLDAIRSTSVLDVIDVDETGDVLALAGDGSDGAQRFAPRELEVLGLLAKGRQPKEIARALGISVSTCRGYVKSLLAKLDAHSALEAVVEAHRLGIIELPSG